jgi:hypothetical protein
VDDLPESEQIHLLSWAQLSAGVYVSDDFKISRRGAGRWVLIDNSTGKEMLFDLLQDAQSRAHWVRNYGRSANSNEPWRLASQSHAVDSNRVVRLYHFKNGSVRLRFRVDVHPSDANCKLHEVEVTQLPSVTSKVKVDLNPDDINLERITIEIASRDFVRRISSVHTEIGTFEGLMQEFGCA